MMPQPTGFAAHMAPGTRARRAGFSIMEMVLAMAMLAVFGLAASQLFSTSTRAASDAARVTRDQHAAETMLGLLRDDVWSAGEIKVRDGAVAVLSGPATGSTTWTLHADGIVTRRRAPGGGGQAEMKWSLPPQPIRFTGAGPSLIVTFEVDQIVRQASFASELLLLRSLGQSAPGPEAAP